MAHQAQPPQAPALPQLPAVYKCVVGERSVTPYMVQQLAQHCPAGLPMQFWNRMVEVVIEERELRDCWETVQDGQLEAATILRMANDKLNSVPNIWANGAYTGIPYNKQLLRISRPAYPTSYTWLEAPDWTTEDEFRLVKESIKEKFYVPRQNPDASTKRYQQAFEAGEMEYLILKELRRREENEPINCQTCGFCHHRRAGCTTFTSPDPIRLLLNSLSQQNSRHSPRQVARSTRCLQAQLARFG